MGEALPELSLQAEERALVKARFISHHEPQRTWSFYVITMVLCGGLWAVTLVPAFERSFGVSSLEMAFVVAAIALAITVATISARLRGGVLSTAYRWTERIETSVLAACAASLIYLSGSASSIFWLIVILLLLHNTPEVLNAAQLRWSHGLSLAAVAALFLADGLIADAVVVAFFGAVLFFLAQTQEQTGRRFLRLQAERDALGRQVEALLVEKERERIARDLHDGLGAQLAALAWTADALTLDADAKATDQQLSELSERARSGLTELRRVVSGLEVAPMRLAELARTVERDGRKLVPPHCRYTVEHRGDGELTGEQCFHLGLMIREAVRNAIQHGGAKTIRVKLERAEDRQLHVEIIDDGAGISEASVAGGRGGIRHLRQRTALLGAALDIAGSSAGTAVRIRVPLQ
jgi:signal transduction histidine kinase